MIEGRKAIINTLDSFKMCSRSTAVLRAYPVLNVWVYMQSFSMPVSHSFCFSVIGNLNKLFQRILAISWTFLQIISRASVAAPRMR